MVRVKSQEKVQASHQGNLLKTHENHLKILIRKNQRALKNLEKSQLIPKFQRIQAKNQGVAQKIQENHQKVNQAKELPRNLGKIQPNHLTQVLTLEKIKNHQRERVARMMSKILNQAKVLNQVKNHPRK